MHIIELRSDEAMLAAKALEHYEKQFDSATALAERLDSNEAMKDFQKSKERIEALKRKLTGEQQIFDEIDSGKKPVKPQKGKKKNASK